MNETPSRLTNDDVELIERSVPYQGHFRVAKYRLRHRLFGGGWSGPISREVFERGHAVAVLPYDPLADKVVLIEQFRAGAYAAGEPAWLTEAIAGMIEPGEQAAQVAIREAEEEAGCKLDRITKVTEYFASPGGSDEITQVFVGRCDVSGVGGIHGLKEENEDIRVLVIDFATAIEMAESGRIHASPPLLALFWLQVHRERLRREWNAV